MADRLRAERPRLTPAFHGELRRRLLAGWIPPARPAYLWVIVFALALSGVALLALGALAV